MPSWRTNPLDVCPVCKAADVLRAEDTRHRVPDALAPWRLTDTRDCVVSFPNHCPACGWCRHHGAKDRGHCETCGRLAVPHHQGWAVADFARPKGMTDEELAFRVKLYQRWAERSASEYRSELVYFADWLADRGSPEEAAARAVWSVYGAKQGDPARWWRWRVELPAAAAWWLSPFNGMTRAEFAGPARARLKGQHHSSRWFLGWPPGSVRFTGVDDRRRWCVTVDRTRSLTYSRAYELTHPAGYVALFHPPGGAAKTEDEPCLFA